MTHESSAAHSGAASSGTHVHHPAGHASTTGCAVAWTRAAHEPDRTVYELVVTPWPADWFAWVCARWRSAGDSGVHDLVVAAFTEVDSCGVLQLHGPAAATGERQALVTTVRYRLIVRASR